MTFLFRDKNGAWLYPDWKRSRFSLARRLFTNLGGFACIVWGVFEIALFVRHNLIQSDIAGPYLYVLALVFAAAWFVFSAATTNPAGSREFLLTNIWRSEYVAVQIGLIVVAIALIRDGFEVVSAVQNPLRWVFSFACGATASLIAYFDRGSLLANAKTSANIDVSRARGWMAHNLVTIAAYAAACTWLVIDRVSFDAHIGIAGLAVLMFNLTIAVVFATFVSDRDQTEAAHEAPKTESKPEPQPTQSSQVDPQADVAKEPRSPLVREAEYPRYRHSSD